MKKDNEFLGTAPIGRLLFKLAIPTIAAQLINMLYNVVDRIYIGHLDGVGDLALTGLGVCMPIIMIISAFAALVGAGGAPRASIFMGKGDKVSAERTMGSCFILQIFVSVILTVLLLIFHEPLLLAFGASENTVVYAADYLKIYSIGTIFVETTLGMNAYITAQGFAREGMSTVMIGAILNIILDPIFIYGFDMGVKGAAVATVISQGVSCIWVLLFLSGKKSVLRLSGDALRFRPALTLPCLALGLAPFIMQASESVISVAFNSSLLKHGGDIAVGAMTILTSVMQLALLPLQGLAQGAQPIISYSFGQKNSERVRKTVRLLMIVSVSYSTLFFLLIMLFPRAFATIFTPDEALLNFTAPVLRIYCLMLGIFGIQVAAQMTFVSLGKALSSVTVAVMRKFVLLLPLIYLMPALLTDKVTAIYLAEPIADFLSVTFTVILFFFQWRRVMRSIRLREHNSAPSKPNI